MKKSYHTIGKQGKVNEQELAGYLARSGQILLPMVDLIEQCRLACDELIDVTGRAAIEAVLQLSASHAAGGPAQQGRRRPGEVVFHGRQAGQVMLSDRKLEVDRPRLRTRGRAGQEVEIPAFSFQIANSQNLNIDPTTGLAHPASMRTITYLMNDTRVIRTGPDLGPIPGGPPGRREA